MKPIELISKNVYFKDAVTYRDMGVFGHSRTLLSLYHYYEKDSILGYYECIMGVLFIIQTKRTYMAFYANKFYFGYNFDRIEPEDIMVDIENEGKIVNKKGWEEMRAKLVADML